MKATVRLNSTRTTLGGVSALGAINSSNSSSLPKTVWMFWHNWAEAPEVAHKSIESWRINNPGWNVRPLSWRDVDGFVNPETIAQIKSLDVPIQHKSDLIRLELLRRHGGVWADATSFCAWPLDEWLPGYLSEGFFAFSRDAKATPGRPIANWFMAGVPGSWLLGEVCDAAWAYWDQRQSTDNYFWFHEVFAETLSRDARFRTVWEQVPKLSCMHPFHLGPDATVLSQPPTELHRRLLAVPPAPVYKLTHKLQDACGPESLRSAIFSATTTPAKARPRSGNVILHGGLPKCASTTLQFWAGAHRETLLSHGINYPTSTVNTHAPKHQEIVRAFIDNEFDPLDALLKQDPATTLFLSTEGLANHFFDLERNPWATARLRAAFAGRRITLVMIRRNRDAWLRSYHQQQVSNPPNDNYLHGTTLRFDEFVQHPRVQRLLDTDKLFADMAELYQAEDVLVADLEGDWAAQVTDWIGVPQLADSLRSFPSQNQGLSVAGTEMLRQANALNLKDGRRLLRWYLWAGRNSPDDIAKLVEDGHAPQPSDYPIAARNKLREVLGELNPTNKAETELLAAVKQTLGEALTSRPVTAASSPDDTCGRGATFRAMSRGLLKTLLRRN